MQLRLPAYLNEAAQNAVAVDAANHLRRYGLAVELDPKLGRRSPSSYFVAAHVPDPGRDLAQLTDRLVEPDLDHQDVARHAEIVFGRDGALACLTAFTDSLAAWSARLGHLPGDDLSDHLAEQTRLLGEMHRQLADTAVRIKVLEALPEDSRLPRTRRNAATATTQAHPAAPTPAEPTAPAAPGQPGSRRAR
ncbi:hypothetical protein [Kitasatospora sp. NPDC001095]